MGLKILGVVSLIICIIIFSPVTTPQQFDISIDNVCCGPKNDDINRFRGTCTNASEARFTGEVATYIECEYSISKTTEKEFNKCEIWFVTEENEFLFYDMSINSYSNTKRDRINTFNSENEHSFKDRIPQLDKGTYNGLFTLECDGLKSDELEGCFEITLNEDNWTILYRSLSENLVELIISAMAPIILIINILYEKRRKPPKEKSNINIYVDGKNVRITQNTTSASKPKKSASRKK